MLTRRSVDAMIFAAGLGTRLLPLTLELPKALVEVAGVPMLERVARRLVAAGADRLIINTHPFPDRIVTFVRERNGFGADAHFSHEPDEPLDTGGGLRQAAPLFRRAAQFFLHNCDVLSDFDLGALYAAHARADSTLATLAVLPAGAQRYLIFDELGLCGYAPRSGGDDVLVRDTMGETRRRDFAGIHVVAPRLLDLLPPTRIFSVISLYLKLAAAGERIDTYEQRDAHWIDIGSHDALARARRAVPGQLGVH